MKTEYTKRQLDAAASLYREREREYRKLDAEAEELLKEGEYVQRERVLRKAELQARYMDGMRRMAEVMGLSEAALLKAVAALEKPPRRSKA